MVSLHSLAHFIAHILNRSADSLNTVYTKNTTHLTVVPSFEANHASLEALRFVVPTIGQVAVKQGVFDQFGPDNDIPVFTYPATAELHQLHARLLGIVGVQNVEHARWVGYDWNPHTALSRKQVAPPDLLVISSLSLINIKTKKIVATVDLQQPSIARVKQNMSFRPLS